jgi:hydroxyacylglutathione hydrolase
MRPEPTAPARSPGLAVTRIPAFEDNYLWLIHGTGDRADQVAAVDPGDADAIQTVLDARGLTLSAILVTHHHGDHIGGVETLVARHAVPVYGPAGEDIPGRTVALSGGESIELAPLGLRFNVIAVPGHTAGHIAYAGHGALFCGDTLFSGGCGRLFEGTPSQMLASLDALSALPAETLVYCAHEYTASNLKFALAVEPGNAALVSYAWEVARLCEKHEPTVPTTIGRERAINPFLRTRERAIREAAAEFAGRAAHDDAEAFRQVREWKNGFRG